MKSEKIQTCEVTASIWLAFLTVMTIATLLCACSSDSGDSFNCATGSVRTSSGIVCGKVVSANGREVHAFPGIPYGETTVADNRWRDPIPKAAASGVVPLAKVMRRLLTGCAARFNHRHRRESKRRCLYHEHASLKSVLTVALSDLLKFQPIVQSSRTCSKPGSPGSFHKQGKLGLLFPRAAGLIRIHPAFSANPFRSHSARPSSATRRAFFGILNRSSPYQNSAVA